MSGKFEVAAGHILRAPLAESGPFFEEPLRGRPDELEEYSATSLSERVSNGRHPVSNA
jgi:hypothetical protein